MYQTRQVEIVERLPTVDEYLQLRSSVDWPTVSAEAAERGLQKSLYSICAVLDGKLVGHGRVVGDGALYFYIQDVAVLQQYQGCKIGPQIMDAIMQWIDSRASHNSFVGLMAAKDVAVFYYRYGFTERPADRPGMYKRT